MLLLIYIAKVQRRVLAEMARHAETIFRTSLVKQRQQTPAPLLLGVDPVQQIFRTQYHLVRDCEHLVLAMAVATGRCVFRQKVQPEGDQQALLVPIPPDHAQLGQAGNRRVGPRPYRNAVAKCQHQRPIVLFSIEGRQTAQVVVDRGSGAGTIAAGNTATNTASISSCCRCRRRHAATILADTFSLRLFWLRLVATILTFSATIGTRATAVVTITIAIAITSTAIITTTTARCRRRTTTIGIGLIALGSGGVAKILHPLIILFLSGCVIGHAVLIHSRTSRRCCGGRGIRWWWR